MEVVLSNLSILQLKSQLIILQDLTASGLTQAYNIDESPVYLPGDTNWDGNEIYGVDATEVAVVNAASGEARLYAPPHSGWFGVTNMLTDMEILGLRVKYLSQVELLLMPQMIPSTQIADM